MIMLFFTLVARRRSAQSLELASNSLLSHLALLFVPAGVGIIVHFERIVEEWLPLTVALLASTVITMIATAAIMLGSIRLLAHGDSRDE